MKFFFKLLSVYLVHHLTDDPTALTGSIHLNWVLPE